MTQVVADSWARDYDEIEGVLRDLESSVPPSELHGSVTGLLVGGQQSSSAEWLTQFIAGNEHERRLMAGDTYRPVTLTEQDVRTLQRFYELVVLDLDSEQLEFSLLLPDDEHATLRQRLSALAAWVQGFLTGVGTSGATLNLQSEDEQANNERREILSDLVEISQVDLDTAEDDENEGHYIQLVEHTKVLVLTLREGLLAPNLQEPS